MVGSVLFVITENRMSNTKRCPGVIPGHACPGLPKKRSQWCKRCWKVHRNWLSWKSNANNIDKSIEEYVSTCAIDLSDDAVVERATPLTVDPNAVIREQFVALVKSVGEIQRQKSAGCPQVTNQQCPMIAETMNNNMDNKILVTLNNHFNTNNVQTPVQTTEADHYNPLTRKIVKLNREICEEKDAHRKAELVRKRERLESRVPLAFTPDTFEEDMLELSAKRARFLDNAAFDPMTPNHNWTSDLVHVWVTSHIAGPLPVLVGIESVKVCPTPSGYTLERLEDSECLYLCVWSPSVKTWQKWPVIMRYDAYLETIGWQKKMEEHRLLHENKGKEFPITEIASTFSLENTKGYVVPCTSHRQVPHQPTQADRLREGQTVMENVAAQAFTDNFWRTGDVDESLLFNPHSNGSEDE